MIKHVERLRGVDKRLVDAILAMVEQLEDDILVISGRRTVREQELLFNKGASKLRGADAPHCRGIAVDLVRCRGQELFWKDMAKFQEMRDILSEHIPLSPAISWDMNHFQLEES